MPNIGRYWREIATGGPNATTTSTSGRDQIHCLGNCIELSSERLK